MRSKAPLALMEQLVMVLVFAVAGVLCLRIFVTADKLSEKYAATDSAVIWAQTAAEIMKSDDAAVHFSQLGAKEYADGWQLHLDENWNTAAGENAYRLVASHEDTGSDFLWRAEVSVFTAEGELLFSIPVSGQNEVGGDRP
ncbi:MAG: hypothetical protein IKV47_07340 [Oscillospiraceae bacterium]|nr:hypothetical protein [Oscillospiraceae bacterium]